MNLDTMIAKRLRDGAPAALRAWVQGHERPFYLSILEGISRAGRTNNGPEWNTLSDAQLYALVRRNYPGAAAAWGERRDGARATFAGMPNADFADWLMLRQMKRQPWPEGRQQVLQEAWGLEAAARGYPNDGTALYGVAEKIADDARKAAIVERERTRAPTRIERAIKSVDDAVNMAMGIAMSIPHAGVRKAFLEAIQRQALTDKERTKWLQFYGDTDAEEAAAKIVDALADDVKLYRDLAKQSDAPAADDAMSEAIKKGDRRDWSGILDVYLAPGSAERPKVRAWLERYASNGKDAKDLLDGRDNAAGTGWSLDEIAQRLRIGPVQTAPGVDETVLVKPQGLGYPSPESTVEEARAWKDYAARRLAELDVQRTRFIDERVNNRKAYEAERKMQPAAIRSAWMRDYEITHDPWRKERDDLRNKLDAWTRWWNARRTVSPTEAEANTRTRELLDAREAAQAQRDQDEAEGARRRDERLVKRAADGSLILDDVLQGQRIGAYYINSEGFPLPALGLGKTHGSAGKRSFTQGHLERGALDARGWVRDHAADLAQLFAIALGLPERPTVVEVDRAVQRAINKGGLSGRGATEVPGIGLAIPGSPFWLDPRMGFAARGGHKELQWVEKTGHITEAAGHMDTAQALRFVTQDGRVPFRFVIHYVAGHVSVGSGGYQERDVFILSPPYAAPGAVTAHSVARKATARDEKDTFIDAFKEAGWAYTERLENEYLTAPSDKVRFQIKQRTVRMQHRDLGKSGAWAEGTSVGPVKKVVTAPGFAAWVAQTIERDTTRKPYQEPLISKADAQRALKAAGSAYPFESETAAYRYGYTAARSGEPDAPPKTLTYGDRDREAWALGYAAGKAPVVTGDGTSGHGSILIHHSETAGTTVRGDTKPIKDTLKAHGFRWYGQGGFWYVPNSKGLATSPIDLDALKRALGV